MTWGTRTSAPPAARTFRHPLGNPYRIEEGKSPSVEDLTENTPVTFGDMDSSPTKAWLVAHRDDPQWGSFFHRTFDKRREELFVLASDPDQINNVAGDPRFEKIRKELNGRLMRELTRTKDPRVTGDGTTFDK